MPVGALFRTLVEKTVLILSPQKRQEAKWNAMVTLLKGEAKQALNGITKSDGFPFFSEKDVKLLLKSPIIFHHSGETIDLINGFAVAVDEKGKRLVSPSTIARFVSCGALKPFDATLFVNICQTDEAKQPEKIKAVAQAAAKLLNMDAKKLGSKLGMNRIANMVAQVENNEEGNALLEVTKNLFAINSKQRKPKIEIDTIAAIAPRVKTSEQAKATVYLAEFFLDLAKRCGNGMMLHPNVIAECTTSAQNLEEANLVKETANNLFFINQRSDLPRLNLTELIYLSSFVKKPEESVARINAFSSLANFEVQDKLSLGENRIYELASCHFIPEQVEAKIEFARLITGLYGENKLSPEELDKMVRFSLFIRTPEEVKQAKAIFDSTEFLKSSDKYEFLGAKLEEMAIQST